MLKRLFNISDLSRDNLLTILDLDSDRKSLNNKSIGLIFEKYSTRTRLSFAVGISSLGGNAIDIKFEDLNFSRDESFEDTFRAMNCYLDGVVYRTSDHRKLLKASEFFEKPIINALSDISHPCQTLGDLLTLKEIFGSLHISILWIGDMNNVCFSLMEAAILLTELNLIICSPTSISSKKNWKNSHNVSILHDIGDIDLKKINCVMTDVFVSMNDEEDNDKIDALKKYTVTTEIMSNTAHNSVFMHCLPAKVGLEVSEEVFRSPKSIVWKQAHNRMVAQKKLLQLIYQ